MTTVLITGASAGLGAAFARGFAAKGCELVLVARDKDRLEAVARELGREFGTASEVLPADLLDPADCTAVAERLADRGRPVDILVNNAGFGLPAPFPYSPVEDEERLLDLLVKVPLRLTHAMLPGLRERRRGAVVNVSSVAGLLPTGTYGAAKAWVTAFSESLRVDMAPYGVRVLAVVPGFTRTEFQARAGMDVSSLREAVWLEPEAVVGKALRDLALGRPGMETPPRHAGIARPRSRPPGAGGGRAVWPTGRPPPRVRPT
ncbi:SDR family NAD(P)-dependent oxidoreductase, partial [Streptomyces sp. NPDC059355]|uniref:SDR family NAD(P)-dependent oxidoreductase n=1 Tax=Streptomyces sp. NPDC059355 TaxID=3346811 RepID=UPI0036CBD88C